MAKPAARFRQAEVERAIRAVTSAGMKIGAVEIDRNGNIRILPESAAPKLSGPVGWEDMQ